MNKIKFDVTLRTHRDVYEKFVLNGNWKHCRYFCPACEYYKQCKQDGGMV